MTSRSLDPRSLVQDWQGPIYNLALRRLGHEADAADVTQEVFIRAFKRLHQLREPAALKAWIYRIAGNAINDAIRRIRRRREVEGEAPPRRAAAEGDLVEQAELRAALERGIRDLPERIAEAISLHYYQGLSQREIGAILQVPRSTVQSQLQKGLSLLKASLAPSGALLLVPDIEAALLSTAFEPVPAELSRRLGSLALKSVGATASPKGSIMIKAKIATFTAAVSAAAFFAGVAVKTEPGPERRRSAAEPARGRGEIIAAASAAGPSGAIADETAAAERRSRQAEQSLDRVREELEEQRQRAAAAEAKLAELRAASLAESGAAEAAFRRGLNANGAEAAAVGALRTITTAQAIFRESDRDRNGVFDYGDLEGLGRAQLVDNLLAEGLKLGYVFTVRPSAASPEFLWWAEASPIPGLRGRYFYTNQSGVIYFDVTGPMKPRGDKDTAPAFGMAIGAPPGTAEPSVQPSEAFRARQRDPGKTGLAKGDPLGPNHLRLLGEPRALLALCEEILFDPQDPDRIRLLMAITGRRKEWEGLPDEVRQALNDKLLRFIELESEPLLLVTALRGLGPVGSPEAAQRIFSKVEGLLSSGSRRERQAAIVALGRLPVELRLAPLRALVFDGDAEPRMRSRALDELRDLQGPALEDLVRGLRADAGLRRRSLTYISEVLSRGSMPFPEELVEDFLASGSGEDRSSLARIIMAFGTERSASALSAAIASRRLSDGAADQARQIIDSIQLRMSYNRRR